MNTDHIVNEVRNARREIFEAHGSDIRRLFQAVMKRQYESGAPVVALNPQTGRLEETEESRSRPAAVPTAGSSK